MTSGLVYNSKLYDTIILEQLNSSNQITHQYFPKVAYEAGWQAFGSLSYSLKLINRFESGTEIPCEPGVGADYGKNASRWKLQVIFPDGSAKDFRPVGHTDFYSDGFYRITPNGRLLTSSYSDYPGWDPPTAACNTWESQATTGGMVYYSTDGSFTRLVVDYDPNAIGNGSMNDFTLYFADGSKFEKNEARLTDRNGNYIEGGQFTYNGSTVGGIVDESGRKVLSVPSSTPGESYMVQLGFGGEELVWTIRRKNVHVRREFKTNEVAGLMERGGSSDQIGQYVHNVVYEIQLPAQYGDLKYEFEYYASDTPLGSGFSEGWGELKSIKLPSGAIADYEYTDADPIYYKPYTKTVLENSVRKKTLKYLTEYDGVSSPQEDVWWYGIGDTDSGVTFPDGSYMTQFHGNTSYESANSGLALRTENSNGTMVERLWSQNFTPWVGAAGPVNPFVKAEFTSIKDANGNYTLTAIKEFAQDKNGNTTSVKEYEFVPYANVPRTNGFPTGLPGGSCGGKICPARTTLTTYHNSTPDSSDSTTNATYAYWNFGAIKGVVASTEVRNASNQVVAKTDYVYDDYSTTANPEIVRVWDSTKGAVSTPLVDGNSVKTLAEYDQYGNVVETTDGNGNVTSITHGNVSCPGGTMTGLYPTLTETAEGTAVERTSSAVYDCYTGLVTTATDVDNNVSVVTEYDDLGRPVKVRNAAGTTLESWVQTEYDDVNRRVIVRADLEMVGDGKKVAVQHFDQLGRVRLSRTLENAATEDPANESHGIKVETRYFTETGYTYQLTSNPYRTTADPTFGWTRSKAWSHGRRSEVETFTGPALPAPWGANTNSTGVVVTESDANATTVTDQAGKLRRSITNALGQLTRVDEPNASNQLGSITAPNQPTSYAYDTLNNLTTVTQGSQTRTFTYSSLSRLLSATNPESGTISYGYDSNGNLTNKTDARSISTAYTYDALNRVTFRNYSDSTPDVDYTYGTSAPKIGKLVKVESSVSTTEYTGFDILGRVTSHKQTTGGVDYTTGYTYYLNGALNEQTYPSGRVVKNTLDTADGSLSQVQSKRSGETFRTFANGFVYNAAGAVTAMKLGNGRWENTTFNSRLQPTLIGLGAGAYSQSLLKLEYSYGTTANNGNVIEQKITVPGVTHPFVQAYTYDELNRLKSATETQNSTQTWKQTFTFDRYGNRNFDEANTTTLVKNCGTSPNYTVCSADVPIVNPSVNTANNKLNGTTYDASGNVITDAEGRQFTYDAENKQVAVENGSSQVIGQYYFDGDGKRVKKVVPNGETTIFVYDASGRLIGEYSTEVQPSQDAKTQYLTSDHLGTPRINTDGVGAVVSRSDYMPYGEEIFSGRSSGQGYVTDDVRQGFTGYEEDDETGLEYAEARMYSKGLGRFNSSDPVLIAKDRVIDPQRLNLYVYVRNHPLKFVDPNGENLVIRITNVVVGYQKIRERNEQTGKFETRSISVRSYRMTITNDSGTQRTFEIARASSYGERGYFGKNGETPPGFYRGTTTEAKDAYDKGFRIILTTPGQETGVAIGPDGTERTMMELHRNYQENGTSLGCALFPTGDRDRLKETITAMQAQDRQNEFGSDIYVVIVPRDQNGKVSDVFDINGDNRDDSNNRELPLEDRAIDVDGVAGRRRISPPVSTAPRHPIP